MKTIVTVTLVALLVQVAFARTFTECSLANELKRYDMPGTLEDWVCLAEAESTFDTSVVGNRSTDGSVNYGLFQINDKYWCGPGNVCGVDCQDLLNDDISDDVACAKTIYNELGYVAWDSWVNRCQQAYLYQLKC